MAVHVFKSTDAGAPTLSGTIGDLTNLLDKLLVTGYNQQTGVTATQAAGVATYTKTAHGYAVNQTLAITGFTSAEYTVPTRVLTVPNANTWTMAIAGTAPATAVGTGTTIVAPLGWSIAFTATNKRAYRMKPGTNQFYMRVADDGTGSAMYARILGYETMSDVDTGAGSFPTNVQVAGGMYVHKSHSANATTRLWRCYSNGAFFHMNVKLDSYWFRLLRFGDFKRLVATDLYNTLLDASAYSSYASSVEGLEYFQTSPRQTSVSGDVYAARSYTGVGTAINVGSSGIIADGRVNYSGGYVPYPSPMYGGMLMAPVMLNESGTASPRGVVPGFWCTPHNLYGGTSVDLDTWSGVVGTELEGRTFELLKYAYNSACPIYEITDTWNL